MENGANELIYKREIRVTGVENKHGFPVMGDQGEVKSGRLGLMDTLLYVK